MDTYLSTKFRNLSFISIIMVVFIHAYNLQDRYLQASMQISDSRNVTSFFEFFISNGLTRAAVPMFFIISGYLFYHNLEPSAAGFSKKIKSRTKSVLLPFLIWSLLSILLSVILQNVLGLGEYIPDYMKVDLNAGSLLIHLVQYPVAFQLWFLRDLFILILLSPIIYLCVRYLSFIPVLAAFLFWLTGGSIPFISLDAILFFSVGAYLAIKKIGIASRANKSLTASVITVWIALLVTKTYFAFEDNLKLTETLHQVSVAVGCFAVWYIYDFFFTKEYMEVLLKRMSVYTFIIYVGHEPIMNLIMDNVLRIQGKPTYAFLLLTYIIIPTCIIFLLIGLNQLMAKFIPSFLKLSTGSRGNTIGV